MESTRFNLRAVAVFLVCLAATVDGRSVRPRCGKPFTTTAALSTSSVIQTSATGFPPINSITVDASTSTASSDSTATVLPTETSSEASDSTTTPSSTPTSSSESSGISTATSSAATSLSDSSTVISSTASTSSDSVAQTSSPTASADSSPMASSAVSILSDSVASTSTTDASTTGGTTLTTSTIPVSTDAASATTTTSACPMTTSFYPERCILSVPAACSQMTDSDPMSKGITASRCTSSLQVAGTLMAEAAPCFTNIDSAYFFPGEALYCVIDAIQCTSTVACSSTATPTPTPTPAPSTFPTATATPSDPPATVTNSGFESGDLTGYTTLPGPPFPPPPTAATISVSDSLPRAGTYSLKIAFTGQSTYNLAWSQAEVGLYPTGVYSLSLWWWSGNNVGETTLTLGVDSLDATVAGGDLNPGMRVNTWWPQGAQPQGKWVQSVVNFTAQASFGRVVLGFEGSAFDGVGNEVFVDDVELVRVA